MTRDNSKRDIWEEVKQEQKEKEELGWNSGYSVDDLKEDYDDLIPPSRYDKIFVSQIGETEFIVDDEDKENYFEIYDLEPDFDEHHYDDRYKNEIGIYRIEEKSTHRWEEILKRVRNETWIKFSQENQDWLSRQNELFTPVEEEHKRKSDEEWKRRKLNQEFEVELIRRRENGDKSVLKYDSLETKYEKLVKTSPVVGGRRTFDYDSSSFEKELEKRIDYFTEVIRQDDE